MTIPYDGPADTRENLLKRIDVENEFKRVYFYKVDVKPKGTDPDTGEQVATVTAVFRVLDNPLPLVPIAWGLTAAIGSASGWFFLDKVEKVTTNPFALLPILGVLATITVYLARG